MSLHSDKLFGFRVNQTLLLLLDVDKYIMMSPSEEHLGYRKGTFFSAVGKLPENGSRLVVTDK
jgi:hypothetical protein